MPQSENLRVRDVEAKKVEADTSSLITVNAKPLSFASSCNNFCNPIFLVVVFTADDPGLRNFLASVKKAL